MPCGILDLRRKTHRCAYCRQSHRKCNGAWPCQHCQAQNIKCVAPKKATRSLVMVAYRHRVDTQKPAKVLIDESWGHHRVFFDAVKSSDSLLFSAYTFEKLGQRLHEDRALYEAITVIGSIYAKQEVSCLEPDVKYEIGGLRNQVIRDLCEKTSLEDPNFLLRFQLLCLAQLMTDETGMNWVFLVRLLHSTFPLRDHIIQFSDHLSPGFLRALSVNIAFCKFYDYSVIPTPSDIPVQYGPLPDSIIPGDGNLDFLGKTLERWAMLNHRARNWISSMRDLEDKLTNPVVLLHTPITATRPPSLTELLEHLSILSAANTLQSELITLLLPVHLSICPLSPFYHWILTGLNHIFHEPIWRLPGCELPVMSKQMRNEQALLALAGAEKCVEKSGRGLDAVFYATVAGHVGREMANDEERERVLGFLDKVRGLGWKVVGSFERDVRESWRKIGDREV